MSYLTIVEVNGRLNVALKLLSELELEVGVVDVGVCEGLAGVL